MLKTFSITDVGKKRQLNQDYVYSCETPIGGLPNLFIVADGMGGHKAGDIASRHTVETMVHDVSVSTDSNPVAVLREAIEHANRSLREMAKADENLYGMGTTVVAATCDDKMLYVANVGDSRLYVVDQEIRQITRDHSLVEEMVRLGGIDRQTARTHPDKNIITRAIGATDKVNVDFFQVDLQEDQLILMCSDGLTNMLEDEEIRMILRGERDIEGKAEELVKAANNNGGQDNIAVILIQLAADEVKHD